MCCVACARLKLITVITQPEITEFHLPDFHEGGAKVRQDVP